MANSLGATLTTLTPGTTARAEDVMNNENALNNAPLAVVEGPHSNAGQVVISIGNGAPSTLNANEIYIQLT